jgi:hypothetical protein
MAGVYDFFALVCATWVMLALTVFLDWWTSGQRHGQERIAVRPGPTLLDDLDRPPPERGRVSDDKGLCPQQLRGARTHPEKALTIRAPRS